MFAVVMICDKPRKYAPHYQDGVREHTYVNVNGVTYPRNSRLISGVDGIMLRSSRFWLHNFKFEVHTSMRSPADAQPPLRHCSCASAVTGCFRCAESFMFLDVSLQVLVWWNG